MRKITYILFLLLALCATSCLPKPKSISLTGTEFNGGELSKLVELVDGTYTITCTEGSYSSSYLLTMKTALKLKEKPSRLESVDVEEIVLAAPCLSIALKDNAGKVLAHFDLEQDDSKKIKRLIKGEIGSIDTITFSTSIVEREKMVSVIESAASATAAAAGNIYPVPYYFDGTIGYYPVQLSLIDKGDGTIHGAYYYKRMNPRENFYLKGYKYGATIKVSEFTGKGHNNGTFTCTIKDGKFTGSFAPTASKRELKVDLSSCDDMKPINLEKIDFNSFVLDGSCSF